MIRTLYIVAGWISLTLGFIGIFLPLLPTTPFILLAAFCFSRGSERLHNWLLSHALFGPMVKDWEQGRVIRFRAKCLATVLLLGMLFYPIFCKPLPLVLKLLLAAIAIGVPSFIWSCPDESGRRLRLKRGFIPYYLLFVFQWMQ